MSSTSERSLYLPGIAPLLRLLRVLGALGLVGYLLLQRSDGSGTPTWQVVMVVLGLLTAGAISLLAERMEDGAVRQALSIAELAIDSLVAIAIAGGSSPVATSTGWVVLVVPVIEGALRFRLRGATLTWLAITAGYVVATFIRLGDLTELAAADDLQTTVRRCGILALVAAPAGALADRLARSMILERRARAKADERGNVLEVIAEAGNDLNQLDGDPRQLLPVAARDLGFTSAAVYRRAQSGWVPMTKGGAHTGDVLNSAADLAAEKRSTMVVDRVESTAEEHAFLRLSQAGTLLVVPIEQDRRTSVLVATTRVGVEPSVHQVDGLHLLVDQTRNALRNRRLVDRLRQARAEIEYQALHDPLTGVANRLLFDDAVTTALDQRSDGEDVAVLFVDLDHFKAINDSHGHQVGDRVLEVVARRLATGLEPSDLVARLSGDEFTVLVVGADAVTRAHEVAERVCSSLAEPIRLDALTLSITASVGVAAAGRRADITPDLLLGDADRAMYSAKQSGRGRWHRTGSPETGPEVAS